MNTEQGATRGIVEDDSAGEAVQAHDAAGDVIEDGDVDFDTSIALPVNLPLTDVHRALRLGLCRFRWDGYTDDVR